jgi:hypothetical protein
VTFLFISMKSSPEGHSGLREALLSASSRLPEGLKVLASDVEEYVEEASRNLSSGDFPKASTNLKEARRILGELRAQSKKGSRRKNQNHEFVPQCSSHSFLHTQRCFSLAILTFLCAIAEEQAAGEDVSKAWEKRLDSMERDLKAAEVVALTGTQDPPVHLTNVRETSLSQI